jgi:HEAT repeat protein
LFEGQDTKTRLIALEIIGQRRMTAAIPSLLKAAGENDAPIRSAALRRLGELAGPAELPALLDLLLRLEPSQDLGAAEQALGAVCARLDNPETGTEKFVAALPQARPSQQLALLRALASVGGARALQAVRAAVSDSNAEIHGTAVRALAAWKTAEVVPDLLALAQKASDPTDKLLGLRGYVAWAAKSDVAADERLAMCRQAAALVQKPEEKKLLLSALGSLPSAGAMTLIVPHLSDTATRDEAGAAAVSVAEKVLQGRVTKEDAAQLIDPLQQVAQQATNADVAQKAKGLLQQARNKASQK